MVKLVFVCLMICFMVIRPFPASFVSAQIGKFNAQQVETDNYSYPVKSTISVSSFPLYFVENRGQIDSKIKYYEKGRGHATFFTKEGIFMSFLKKRELKEGFETNTQDYNSETIKLIPIGANRNTDIVAEELQVGRVNYFIGNDSNGWLADIPTYKAVSYKEIYRGIDMKFYGNEQQFEYDIVLKPGSDPSMLKLSLDRLCEKHII